MPYSAKAIANYFLDLAEEQGQSLSPMKLQKLVYFAHGWYMALTGKPLLDEQVQAWSYGPVIHSLYSAFADYGSNPITGRATTVDHVEGLKFKVRAPRIDENQQEDNQLTKRLLRRVWDLYGGYSAVQLTNLTHAAGTPWDRVNKQYNGNLPKFTTIPEDWIREYFQAQRKSA
jgi:uncharacterized phage-associated protein